MESSEVSAGYLLFLLAYLLYSGITITEIKTMPAESFVKWEINSIGSAVRVYREDNLERL